MIYDDKYKLRQREGVANQIAKNAQSNLSSIFPKNSNTFVYTFYRALAREIALVRQEGQNLVDNFDLNKIDQTYAYVNFGYLLHPNNVQVLLNLSVPYITFIKVLAKYLVLGSRKQYIEDMIKELTGFNAVVHEHYISGVYDISEKFTFDIDLYVESESISSVGMQDAIKDISYIVNIIKPAHIWADIRFVLNGEEDVVTLGDTNLDALVTWTPKDSFWYRWGSVFTWYFSDWGGDDVWYAPTLLEDEIVLIIIEP
ncbi:MAG: hypothetical protein WC783_02625 [Candidatus Paceibacterota bacterium]|jgi:hypothetical protein